jgi:zinc transport system substrate-binding protein
MDIKKRKIFQYLLLVALAWMLLLMPGVAREVRAAAGTLKVYVVNYPLKYFAQRIAGKHAEVFFPAPPDGDPAYWTPDVGTIEAYQKADLILLNGAGYAGWVNKVSLPRSKTVNTSKKFKDRYIRTEGIVTHSHGTEGKHAHEDVAFTTWLDFDLATNQAGAIRRALVRKRPDLKSEFQKNFTSLARDLKALDQKIKTTVKHRQARPLIGSHPVYDYFTRGYKLNMKSVHWEPDEIPAEKMWMALGALLKEHPARWMVWEGDPLRATVKRLGSLGINSLVFDPCGNVPAKGDFLTIMRQNAINLQMAFQ